MKNFIKAFRLTLVLSIFLSVSYVLVLRLFALVAGPGGGGVEMARQNGKVVGAVNIGQQFYGERYFHGRPSCAGEGYDATRSGGSNMGPTNPQHLARVEARIEELLARHPYLSRKDIPVDLVTASASGLDPHISPQAAHIQVRRVANARGMSEKQVDHILTKCIDKPLLGCFGPEKVNVLQLNMALDRADHQK